jgi:hypothetical protein
MPVWAWTAIKWTLAVAGMGVVVVVAIPRALDALSHAVSFDMDRPAATAESPTPVAEPDTVGGETAASASASVRAAVVDDVGPDTVTLGGDGADELLITFEAVPTDPACLTQAQLEVAVSDASGSPEVRVRPARVADLTDLSAGDPLPADVALDPGDPVSANLEDDPDVLRWTVTAVYSIAAREAASDANVVLSLALDPESGGSVTVRSATGDVEHPPRLTWTAVEGCPGFDDEAPQDA